MRVASINLEFLDHLPTKAVVRQHAFDRVFDDTLRMTLEHIFQARLAETARELRMAIVELLLQLVSSDRDLACIQDNHIVTSIQVGGEGRLVLAAQDMSDLRSETPQAQIRRVDHKPGTFDCLSCGGVGLKSHLALL